MVNLIDTFGDESGCDSRSFVERMERRDFLSTGRNASEVFDYFKGVNTHISEGARKVQSIARNYGKRVEFVIAPPGVMAYVNPGISDTVFYNFFYLLQKNRQDGKTIHHEVGHLKQDSVTGNAYEIPGFDRLSEDSTAIIEKKLGVKIEPRDLVEGAIEGRTKRALGKDENCVYHAFEVPLFEKFARLIAHYTGKDVIPLFDQLTTASTREMADIIALGGNLMLLEEAAKEMGGKIEKPQKIILFLTGKSLMAKNRYLKSIAEAKSVIRSVRIEDNEVPLAA